MPVLKEFREFILRGNLVDLAVAVVIGTRKCPECVSEIPVSARRCAFCTTEVTPAGA